MAHIRGIAWDAEHAPHDIKLVERLAELAHNLPYFLANDAGGTPDPAAFNPDRLRAEIALIGDGTPERQRIRDDLLGLLPDSAHKKAALLRR